MDAKDVKEDIEVEAREIKDDFEEENTDSETDATENVNDSYEETKAKFKEGRAKFREDMKENREKFGETYTKGKDVAEKVGENLSKTFEDTIIAMKSLQKDLDGRYKEYRETAVTNKINVDLVDDEDCYYMQAYLPGIPKEDIEIEASKNAITIKVEFKNIFDKLECDEDNKPELIISGIRRGLAERTINLSKQIEIEEVTAKHNNGVLFLKIPKTEIPKTKINID